jgi:hypothetical protein
MHGASIATVVMKVFGFMMGAMRRGAMTTKLVADATRPKIGTTRKPIPSKSK